MDQIPYKGVKQKYATGSITHGMERMEFDTRWLSLAAVVGLIGAMLYLYYKASKESEKFWNWVKAFAEGMVI